jgi:hypothetical protein
VPPAQSVFVGDVRGSARRRVVVRTVYGALDGDAVEDVAAPARDAVEVIGSSGGEQEVS